MHQVDLYSIIRDRSIPTKPVRVVKLQDHENEELIRLVTHSGLQASQVLKDLEQEAQ